VIKEASKINEQILNRFLIRLFIKTVTKIPVSRQIPISIKKQELSLKSKKQQKLLKPKMFP